MFTIDMYESLATNFSHLCATVHFVQVASKYGDLSAARQVARLAAAIDIAADGDGLRYAK